MLHITYVSFKSFLLNIYPNKPDFLKFSIQNHTIQNLQSPVNFLVRNLWLFLFHIPNCFHNHTIDFHIQFTYYNPLFRLCNHINYYLILLNHVNMKDNYFCQVQSMFCMYNNKISICHHHHLVYNLILHMHNNFVKE